MKNKNLLFHFVALFVSSAIIFLVSAKYDLHELIHGFVESYEYINLDGLFLIGFFATIYFLFTAIVFSIRLKIQNSKILVISEELKQELVTKSQYHTIIAHDLKSPFNALIGFSKMLVLNSENMSDEKRKKYYSVIYDTSKKSFELLENLLEWSRIQNKSIRADRDKLDLRRLVISILVVRS